MKKFLILLSSILMIFGLASCNGDKSSSQSSSVQSKSTTQSSSSSKSSSKSTSKSSSSSSSSSSATLDEVPELDTSMDINISFWHTMGKSGDKISTLQRGIDDFEKLYPNIKVTEFSTGGGYDDLRDLIIKKLQADTDDFPNITYCYPDHVAMYNEAKATVTLDKYIDSPRYGLNIKDINDFVPAFYNEGKSFGDGKMYLLPFSKSTELFYYNKTEFEKNKWEVPATWNDLWTLCKTIKENYVPANPDTVVTPFAYDSSANWFISMSEQFNTPYTSVAENGEGQYLFNNDQNKAFVKDLVDQFNKGYFTTHAILNNYVNINSENPKFMMAVSSSAGSSYHLPAKVDGVYPFEVGVATIPQVDPNNKKVISQGPDIVMLKARGANDHIKEQKELASWLFMKYLTSTNFSAQFSMASGYMPVRKSSQGLPTYQDWLNSADNGDNLPASAAALAMAQADYYFTSPAFDGSSVARSEVENLMKNAFSGVDIDKAFLDAYNNCTY